MKILNLDLYPAYIPFIVQCTKAAGDKVDPTVDNLIIYEEGGADATFDSGEVTGSPFDPAQVNSKTGLWGVLIAKTVFTAGKFYIALWEMTVDSITTAKVERYFACNASSFMATVSGLLTTSAFNTKIPSNIPFSGADLIATLDGEEVDIGKVKGVGVSGVADFKADISSLAIEGNVEGHVTTALNSYDPPTRTELTSDKSEIIGEINANETKIDVIDGIVDDIKTEVLTHPTLIEIEATTVLAKTSDLSGLSTFNPASDEVDVGKIKGVGVSGVADFKADISTLAVEANIAGHVTDSLNSYDSPTRAELTSDKDAIIAEIDANETKIDAVQSTADAVKAKTDNLPADPADASDLAALLAILSGYTDEVESLLKNGTYGLSALKVLLDSLGTGSGLRQITVQVYQLGTTTPIVGANVQVWNTGLTVLIAKGISDAGGQVIVNLDDDDYKIKCQASSYSFSTTDITVAADATEIIYGTAITIGTPVSGDACRVYEYCFMPDSATPMATAPTYEVQIISLPYSYNGKLHAGDVITGVYNSTTGLLYWDIAYGAKVRFIIPQLFGNTRPVYKTIPSSTTVRLSAIV